MTGRHGPEARAGHIHTTARAQKVNPQAPQRWHRQRIKTLHKRRPQATEQGSEQLVLGQQLAAQPHKSERRAAAIQQDTTKAQASSYRAGQRAAGFGPAAGCIVSQTAARRKTRQARRPQAAKWVASNRFWAGRGKQPAVGRSGPHHATVSRNMPRTKNVASRSKTQDKTRT